jgi:glycosyltransferase involved in cell wall biosynthesis
MIWFISKEFAYKKPWSARRKVMDTYYRFVPERAARNAAAVLTVSHAAKDSIVQYLDLPYEKIFVTYEAANSIYRQVDDEDQIEAMCQKFKLKSEYILALGSADPRKNISTLVQAYSLLPVALQQRYRLVIVWTHHFLASELNEKIQRLGLKDQVQFLQQVSDENLALLYNAASLFVFPSKYEGFGLPLLEAMACGTPVTASSNTSIPEIAGDAALYFSADDANAMAGQMAQLLMDRELQKALIIKGFERASKFSWMNCGLQTLKVYERILSSQN